MKNAILLLSIILIACDPRGELYDPGQTISIKAQVINPKIDINLGDSVAFYFEVPDTVEVNGSKVKVAATGRDDGANLGFSAHKINPASIPGNDINPGSCERYANPGSLTANKTLVFANQGGKLLAKFYMIPREKGVYFLHQSQEGYAWLNNKGLSVRLSINFGNVNRNHQMLIDSAGAASNFSLFLQDRVGRGMEIYGFRVN
jgi:hypothetical protein